jgi:phage terminase large subunit-like protein
MILTPTAEIWRRFKKQEQLIDFFEPLTYQKPAWFSKHKFQLFEGGNRSGKTELVIAKIVAIALGTHPEIKRVGPQKIRIIATVLNEGALTVIVNKLKKFIPVRKLRGESWRSGFRVDRRTFYFKNGSTIQLMATTQDLDNFRGEDLDIVVFDEEPPEDIFDENITRLADRNGMCFLSMTPHKGLTWSWRRLVKEAGKNIDIAYFFFDPMKNYYINRREHLRAVFTMSQREFQIRILGKRISLEGLVYYPFEEEKHVIAPFVLPASAQLYLGVDYGLQNPTAGTLWAVVPGEGSSPEKHYIVDEYYETGRTVKQNAERMATWLRDKWGTHRIRRVYTDPNSGSQRSEQTSERNVDVFRTEFWRVYGKPVPVILGKKEQGCVEHRINRVLELLSPDASGKVRLQFFSTCFHHIDEIENYIYPQRRDENMNKIEKPKEYKNHLMNAMEYIAETNPHVMVDTKRFIITGTQYDRVSR